jgi:alpha-ketoglutarate-dependent taurine dioxygenase
MREVITEVDRYICKIAPGPLRVERVASFLDVDEKLINRLLNFYFKAGAFVKHVEIFNCPNCDVIIEKPTPEEEHFCDLCEQHFSESELETEWVFFPKPVPVSIDYLKERAQEETMLELADDYQRNKIERWNKLYTSEFLYAAKSLGESECREILDRVQRYGICQFRFIAQSAEEEILYSMERLMGPAFDEQNDFKGKVNTLRPSSAGAANSGQTSKDLGLHVDGTQHTIQPAMLIFQFVAEPKHGADSIFVDTASALFDLDDKVRKEVLAKLARPDAATFSKKGMTYTGPIFSLTHLETVACRARFDEVIQVHPTCEAEFNLLKEQVHKDKYKIRFKPIEGDILIFDNWRLLHARDEVFGERTREHRRMWLYGLLQHLQSDYKLGIRALGLENLLAIKQANNIK